MEGQARAGDVGEKAVDAKIKLAELMADAPTNVLRTVLGNGESETD